VASALLNGFRFALDEKFRNTYINLSKWFAALVSQKEWTKVNGKCRLCKTAMAGFKASADTPKEAPKKVEKKAEPKKEAPKKVE
jgi:hypothetical protein